MNHNQLATIDEAKQIAKELGTIGGGVAAIEIPQYFGPFAAPEDGDKKFYHFRFQNGADGFNVGLVRCTMQIFPSRWPLMVATEVNAAAKKPEDQ